MFSAVLAKGVRISRSILMTKAEEYAHKLSRPRLCCNGRLVVLLESKAPKCAHRKMSTTDAEASEEWTSTLLPQLLQEYIYDPEDIYNADETGLYCRGTLDGSLCSVTQRKP